MLTLAIDTATKTMSVALLSCGGIVAETFLNVNVNHSLLLLPVIDDICLRGQVKLAEIDVFACTTGPGSFTGLRIGVSTIKGFALATGRPVAGISTLEALAFNAAGASMLVCPMLDARKEQVYTAMYRPFPRGTLERVGEEKLTDPASYLADIHEDCLFLGDGAMKYEGMIRSVLSTRSFFASGHQQHVRAAAVGLLGERDVQRGNLLDPVTISARYIRKSEAELKRWSAEKRDDVSPHSDHQ